MAATGPSDHQTILYNVMTWQNFLALAVFVGVCGFIAYWGDILGRRMGKRRLTLFGLRPRYTAIVTTTITGMLIAILTIFSLAAVNKEFQQLILQGHRIVRGYNAAREKYNQVTKKLRKATNEAQEAVKKGDSLTRQIDLIDDNLARMESQLSISKAGLARTEADLKGAQGNLDAAERQLADKKDQVRKQEAAIETLKATRQELEVEKEAWNKGYSQLRAGTIIFRPNQDIARRVIRCAQEKNEIRAELYGLLNEASKIAENEGATVGDNGRAVIIRPIKQVFEGQERKFTEADIINYIADLIHSGSGSVVARVYSITNSFEGEQTLVDCEPIANRLIYLAGDEVASTEIDGSLSRGDIFSSLVTFLQNDVSSAARLKGVSPKYTETGPSVGEIDDWNEVFDMVLKIKSTGKKVQVKAIAARETWSVGPMLVNFTISDSQ